MGKSGNFPRPSIRFSYAYPHQKLRPKSSAQSSIKTPLKTQNSGVSIEFSEHPKIPMKNFTLSDHENAFVRTRECVYLPICIVVSVSFPVPFRLHFVFQFVLPARRHLHPRNYAYVEQDISAILCEKFKQDFWLLCIAVKWSVCQGIIMRNLCGVFFIKQK